MDSVNHCFEEEEEYIDEVDVEVVDVLVEEVDVEVV